MLEPVETVTEADINSVWTSWAVSVPVIVAPAKVTTPSPSNRAPLASAVVTLVEKLPLSVFKSDTRVEKEPLAVTKSFIEPEPSNKLTLVEKLALDSVIEPLPSNKLTLVEREPLADE